MPSVVASQNEPQQPLSKKPPLVNLMKFTEAKEKITKLVNAMDEQEQYVKNCRHLRYTEIDIEAERKSGRIAPDELYVPQHIIDTNIRREQAKYISYVSSARRAAIFHDLDNQASDTALLENDFTNRFRYDGWQLPLYRCIDGMQQNGYGFVELVGDVTQPGHLKLQDVAYGDIGFSFDTRDIQSCELITRRYYFTKTQLLAMASSDTWKFSMEETLKVMEASPEGSVWDDKETSLYPIQKVMFRKGGIVMVAWSCVGKCNDWLKQPRPLYIGRQTLDPLTGKWVKAFETSYPYYVAVYNITENTILKQVKGRAYMDQDTQEGVSSLMSSFVTAHRRAAGLYFARDGDGDPNNDQVTQQNNYFKQGRLIDAKVKQFQLQAPDSSMLSAIQALATMNMQENSQIDYASQNRKDSRKTATEIQAALTESQLLGTIQLALFSTFMKQICTDFFAIVRSRVMAGLIGQNLEPQLQAQLNALYKGNYQVRPAGDTDVIEKQEKILRMQQTWPVVQATAAAPLFLAKLLTLMFPEDAPLYNQMIQQDQTKTTMLASVAHVLQGLIADPQQLSPQAQTHIPEIQGLLQQIGQVLNPQQQGGGKQAQPPQQ